MMSEKVQMHIQIRTKTQVEENVEPVLEYAMERIDQTASDPLEWKRQNYGNGYETECDICENEILPVFQELISAYPDLDLYAVYSYDIREDDRSAQWWGTTKISTEHHPDGTAELKTDSSTNWF